MATTPPIAGPAPPLSLLVLLPGSSHMRQPHASMSPPHRPAPLASRQSGSTVPSMRQLAAARKNEQEEQREEAEIDKVISAGRRLSLAPGIGAGTQIRSGERLEVVTDEPTPTAGGSTPLPYEAREAPASYGALPSSELQTTSPAFGAKRGLTSRGPPSRRRPQTAAHPSIPLGQALASNLGNASRGSLAFPHGSGFGPSGGGSGGRARPGWEGDEVVGVLRNSGLEGKCTISRLRCSKSLSVPFSEEMCGPLSCLGRSYIEILRDAGLQSGNHDSTQFSLRTICLEA